MQIQDIRPKHKLKKKKRIGRGGKHGTYSGKGIKGQKSRAGRKFKPIIRELIKKYPKLRGYRFKSRELSVAILNLDILEKNFNAGETVSPQSLLEKKLIRKIKGAFPKVKILAGGNLTKALIIEGCKMSEQAKEKIEKIAKAIK